MNKFGSNQHALRLKQKNRIKRKRTKQVNDIYQHLFKRNHYTDDEKKKLIGKHIAAPAKCSCANCRGRKREGDTYQQKREFEKLNVEFNELDYTFDSETYFPFKDNLFWYEDDHQEWIVL